MTQQKFKQIMHIKNLLHLKYVLNTYINFKSLLEALLLDYIGFTQYEIHF